MRWVTARVRSISIFKVDCGIPAATVRQACKQTPRCLDSRSVTGAVLTLPELPDQVARVRDIRKIPVATHPLPFPYNVDTLIRCASPLSLPHARPQRCTAFPGIPSSSWHLRIRDCLFIGFCCETLPLAPRSLKKGSPTLPHWPELLRAPLPSSLLYVCLSVSIPISLNVYNVSIGLFLTVLLCHPHFPGVHYADQANLEPRSSCLCFLNVAGIKGKTPPCPPITFLIKFLTQKDSLP